jgi:hypothetical protein
MATGECADSTVDVSETGDDDSMDQATVFDNINYMGRAVIGMVFFSYSMPNAYSVTNFMPCNSS